jgi:excisionase family DNA binding protein
VAQTETTAAARERLRTMVDEHLAALSALLKAQADVLLEHTAALAREAAAARSPESKTRIYNRKEVARLLSCSVGTVDNLVRRGELGYTRRWAGGPKCFTWAMVNEYIERLNERGEKYAQSQKKRRT